MAQLPETPDARRAPRPVFTPAAALMLLLAAGTAAQAQVQMGVTGLFSNMTPADAAANLNGRSIATKRGDDGTLLFPLGDGTTRSTVRGMVSFSRGDDSRLTGVDFAAEGETAALQYVSWLFQTGARYGAPKQRNLSGTVLSETYCYSRDLAVLLQLADRKATLSFSTAPEHLRVCSGTAAKRDFDAVAYQVGPPASPPGDLQAGRAPAGAGNSPAAARAETAKAERAALEQRFADLGYCHGLYMRLTGMSVLPPAKRREASDAMGRVREQGRSVQRQLGYSDETAEQTFGQAAGMRQTSGLRSQQDFTRAVSDCRAKNAA